MFPVESKLEHTLNQEQVLITIMTDEPDHPIIYINKEKIEANSYSDFLTRIQEKLVIQFFPGICDSERKYDELLPVMMFVKKKIGAHYLVHKR